VGAARVSWREVSLGALEKVPLRELKGGLRAWVGLSITGLAGEIRVLKLILKELLCSSFLC
jgi:hypothetical protein